MTSSGLHFFKIIQEDMVGAKKLLVPSSFVRDHDLSDSVLLKVPSGANWPVYVLKSEGNVWFEKGWREFAKFYTVDYGYVLAFKYEDSSHLSVVIFDQTNTEISYRVGISHQEPTGAEDSETELQTSTTESSDTSEGTDDSEPDFEAVFESEDDFCQNSKRPRAEEAAYKYGRRKFTGKNCAQSVGSTSKQPRRERIKAFKESSKFTSIHPYFIVPMQPGDLGYKLRVPTRFSTKYLKRLPSRIALTIPSDGKKQQRWKVRHFNENKRVSLSGGYINFVKDNNLEPGDICVFELIDGAFRVYIFRGDENGGFKSSYERSKKI